MGPGGKERRRLRRVMKKVGATFETPSVRAKGHIKNFSKQGIYVRSNVLPMPGDRIAVRFESRSGDKVEIIGTVCWTTAQIDDPGNAPPGFGVELNELNDAYLAFFEDLLLH